MISLQTFKIHEMRHFLNLQTHADSTLSFCCEFNKKYFGSSAAALHVNLAKTTELSPAVAVNTKILTYNFGKHGIKLQVETLQKVKCQMMLHYCIPYICQLLKFEGFETYQKT